MKALAALIETFGTLAALAETAKIPYQTVAAWKRRERIPADYWPALIKVAKRRGLTLSHDDFYPPRRKKAA